MYLDNLTLQKPTGIYQAITGSFSAPKIQEIVVSKGNILELFGFDQNGKLATLISKEVFGQIRKIIPFRLTGNKKDFIIVGSDSGRIVVLEANLEKRDFIRIHQETFGKTGCRRIVPGEFLACDPKGRAIMIGAIEKQKFVYIINRDTDNKMTISSPLEAHKSNALCFDICGLDVGYENPMFACIEVDYGDADNDVSSVNTGVIQKLLVYYEMDLGLNHVVRKNYDSIDNSAHLLVPIPCAPDGPGGVVVFCENFLVFKKTGHEDRITPYPQRNEFYKNPNKTGLMMINYTVYKRKEIFFILSQSEIGDLYKITLNYTGEMVHGITVQYFDTVPVANSISLLLTGFFFCSSETSDHLASVDEKEEEVCLSYSTIGINDPIPLFNPRELKNLHQLEIIPSLSCITDMMVEDLANEGTPHIYTISGKGPRSSLRILKSGLTVTDIGSSSLPGKPTAIWTLKGAIGDKFDKYIVVSFPNVTLVLSIGEKVAEITNSGFDLKKSSLHVGIMADNTFIQIFSGGIIHIRGGKKSLYQTSAKILGAASNIRQIVVALQDKEIMYFELEDDKLAQVEKKVMDKEITCIDIGPIPEGRQRSKFVAIGCIDNSVRILSLEIDQCLTKISMQMLPSSPESVLLTEMNPNNGEESEWCLFIGLANGVLIKTTVDKVTGMQSDMHTKYLGNRGVSLFKILSQCQPSILANSSKPWICYNYMGRYYTHNLNYDSIDYASNFSSEQCNEGIVTIVGNSLKILSIERLGEMFTQTVIPLRYTPRKMVVNRENNNIIIIESDQNTFSKSEKEELKKEIAESTHDTEYLQLGEDRIGSPISSEGKWASCIRMIEPYTYNTIDLREFEENEAAFSACVMSFASTPGETYLIIGTANDMKLHPRTFSATSIIVFVFKDQGRKIEFLFRNPVEDIPLAFCEFQGRLLAGVGNILRIYDIGKTHLLKKCETKKLSSVITGIYVNGQRILVSTMNESFHLLRHKTSDNQLYVFADDVIPRWITCATFLDYDTVAGCDKFENFFIYRLPSAADEESEEDPIGSKHKWDVGYLHGAAYKLDLIAQFHRGDLITSIKKCSLLGAQENVIVYATTSGAIGVFMPLETREEVDFFIHLEMYLRVELSSVVGRDHQMYRSSYGPVKCVIDGDLCEEFLSLELTKQKQIAGELDKTPSEVQKKMEDLRNKII